MSSNHVTTVSSKAKSVLISRDKPTVIIGERINPTGRRIFSEQLRRGDLSRVEIDVAQQIAGGAMVLDVNMGAPLADEAELEDEDRALLGGKKRRDRR